MSILSLAISLSICIPAFGSDIDAKFVPISTDLETIEKSVQPRFPGNACLYSIDIYPAKIEEKGYYTGAHTKVTNPGGQILNAKLNSQTAALYNEMECDGYYIKVVIDTAGALFYDVYDNKTLFSSGYCTNQPNLLTSFNYLVKNNNPAQWRIVLFDAQTTNGKPFWGSISMP